MNSTISTFMKIAITVGAIALLLFGTAYTMTKGEQSQYETKINSGSTKLGTTLTGY